MTSARASMLHQRVREVIAAAGGLTSDEQHDLLGLMATLLGRPAPAAYRSAGSHRVVMLASTLQELLVAAQQLPVDEQHQLVRVMVARLALLEQCSGKHRPLTMADVDNARLVQ